jgi:hypothetical protein
MIRSILAVFVAVAIVAAENDVGSGSGSESGSVLGSGCIGTATECGWQNHLNAFGTQDLDKIMLDYTEDSMIAVHDIATGNNAVIKGMDDIRAMFSGLFDELDDLEGLGTPVIKVESEPVPQVFLVWECPSSGITQATDTFAFDDAGKIIRQNIVVWRDSKLDLGESVDLRSGKVVATGTDTQSGWDNHFLAFGEQDLDKIMLDYTEESEINIYNWVTKENTVHTGMVAIRAMFEGLFTALHDNSLLDAPVVMVEDSPIAQVFLVWESPASDFAKVTDSFLFDDAGKIIRQNIVVQTAPYNPPAVSGSGSTAPATPTEAGWENHLTGEWKVPYLYCCYRTLGMDRCQ